MKAIFIVLVLSVTDGDTFRGRVQLWPGQTLETAIRIVGIDTPEIRGKCTEEKKRAIQARDALSVLLLNRSVFLSHVEPDKYGGRYLATVHTAEGVDVGSELLKRGLAASYAGEGPKRAWCKK